MEKKEQLLVIHPPHELKFHGPQDPFKKTVLTVLHLMNPTDRTILFKIKTTAPRKYCVRPNFGAISARAEASVDIYLQVQEFDPNEKNKHKFMVQSLVVPEGVIESENKLIELWKDVPSEELMETKLRCVFELTEKSPASDTAVPKEGALKNETATIKAAGDDKTGDYLFEYMRATEEISKLREEQNLLRQENLKLKEQLLRVKITTEANQKEQQSATSSSQYQNPYSPPQSDQLQFHFIIIAIAMGIVGLLLGKYFL